MRFFRNPNYDFMSIRKIAMGISLTLIALSIISLIIHGGPRYGVDFRGGTFMEIKFEDPNDPEKVLDIPIDKVRAVLADFGLAQAEVKHYGSTQEVAIRADVTKNTDQLMNNLVTKLEEKFPGTKVLEMRKETVGPKVGKELVWAAIWAILVAMLLILVYLMWRFELRFGIGAVAALFHDVTITLGIFSVLNIEITVPIVAALLTIIGYSLNDTIVVYDRIRENLKGMRRKNFNFEDLINTSINETLSRTIITSGTTLIVVLVLYLFGGEVIKDFAFALLLGIIIGTYSSIYIASPILVEWEDRIIEKTVKKK